MNRSVYFPFKFALPKVDFLLPVHFQLRIALLWPINMRIIYSRIISHYKMKPSRIGLTHQAASLANFSAHWGTLWSLMLCLPRIHIFVWNITGKLLIVNRAYLLTPVTYSKCFHLQHLFTSSQKRPASPFRSGVIPTHLEIPKRFKAWLKSATATQTKHVSGIQPPPKKKVNEKRSKKVRKIHFDIISIHFVHPFAFGASSKSESYTSGSARKRKRWGKPTPIARTIK